MELIVSLIAVFVSIGLIVAIFQMNGRIGHLLRKQDDLVRIQQWQLVTSLIEDVEIERVDVEVFSKRRIITEEQEAFIAHQKGWLKQ